MRLKGSPYRKGFQRDKGQLEGASPPWGQGDDAGLHGQAPPCPGGPLPPWGGGPGQLWGPGRRQLTSHNEPKTGQMAALTQGVCPEDQAPPSGGPPPQTGPLWGETLWKLGRRLLASQNAGGSFSRRWEALPGHPGDPGDDTGCPASQPPGHTPRGQCRGPTAFTL